MILIPLLFFWIVAMFLQLVSGIIAVRRSHRDGQKVSAALVVSGFASILPCFALLMFFRVFVLGGSSSTAQFAGSEGLGLWSEWFHIWPLFMFGGPLALLICLVAAALPPYSSSPPSQLSRVCAVICAGCTCIMAMCAIPDA